ncbi:Pentatricopeptide repeat-containing protein [Striga hermonthica]|uniref:Pentatricopeptide repeat-containing protein n=1 Tax=Striga hermonthica TaxID=68872 RepID=A0A9N7NK16_STRHE|nr:Pentatricopeptide repeat-containing protein [Striga hermonthica]
MAALIHHNCLHPAAGSAALTLSANSTVPHSKPFAHSQVTSSLFPSKTSLSLSSSKTQLFPSFPATKIPSFQHNFTADHPINPKRLSNHELSRLLKLSIEYRDAQLGKAVHASILKVLQDLRLFNSLISSYIELGNLNYAERVFNCLLAPDIVSFTAMISCLAKSSREGEAVGLFFEMRGSGIEPNAYAFVALLTACMRLLDLELGSQVHALSIQTGHLNCSYVANSLMALYGKCGCFDRVVKLFVNMPQRDSVSWNTVISCLVKDGMYDRAFQMFQSMIMEGFKADYFTLSSVLVACTMRFAKLEGTAVHAYAHKIGYENNLSVRNALFEFYAKCGCAEDVGTLFDRMPVRDISTWTQMINAHMGFGLVDLALEVFTKMPKRNYITYNAVLSGFCQNGHGSSALRFFQEMVGSGMEIDDFTLTGGLNACALIRDLKSSEQVQAFVHKIDFGTNEYIQAALLDMCTKCGRMSDAEKMFDRLPLEQRRRSSIMLTTMISGYARNSNPEKALSLINKWLYEEEASVLLVLLDEVALTSVFSVCGDLGFMKLGEQFHAGALKYGLSSEIGFGNSIISMYSKCGDMEKAIKAFDKMSKLDIVSWNSVLNGYIVNRQGEKALHIWEKMQRMKIQPDKVTCVLIISAYQHTSSSLVDQCRDFFFSIKSIYQIKPNSDHYACFVGVLGHWGFLEEAEEVIEKMPFEPEASVWRALLDSCRVHENVTIGKRAAKNILEMEPQDTTTYVLKSNLYSASGRWHCSELVREKMKERRFRKFPARSWVVHDNKVHSFFARDNSHVQSKDIYSALDILFSECSKAGYLPDTRFVLHDVEEHQKVNFLLYHSGKLAAAYGVLMARPGKPAKVFKNVHLCGDCHTFLKYVSIVTKREIHFRDGSGFHRFANGECSCRDCW